MVKQEIVLPYEDMLKMHSGASANAPASVDHRPSKRWPTPQQAFDDTLREEEK